MVEGGTHIFCQGKRVLLPPINSAIFDFLSQKGHLLVARMSRDSSLAVSLMSLLRVSSNSPPCRGKKMERGKNGSYKTWRMNSGNLFQSGKAKLFKNQDMSMTSPHLSQYDVKG